MQLVLEHINKLRQLSGNEQLKYLEDNQSSALREVLEYTYDPDKKYKIERGKFIGTVIRKGLFTRKKKVVFSRLDWVKFTEILDTFADKRAVTDSEVRHIKQFILDFVDEDVQSFLAMVLYKDLRLNLGIKKIQTVWPDFCDRPQVQLAEEYDGTKFKNGLFSRKFDGKRMYVMDGVAYSRSNKPCKVAPIEHILFELKQAGCDMVTFDGEVLYFDEEGNEDFQKGISLTSSDARTPECNNLYYVIFDSLNTTDFKNKTSKFDFKFIYDLICSTFKAKDSSRFGYSILDTDYPHILIARQEYDDYIFSYEKSKKRWEGLMYRNADAPYRFKRTKDIMKIKDMKDGEFDIHSLSEGTGKNEGRLGALNIFYKDSFVGVGSGFTDEDRELIWANSKLFLSKPFNLVFRVKVQYFEETVDAKGNLSLRFPVFLCFRHIETEEEYTVIQAIEFCEERGYVNS